MQITVLKSELLTVLKRATAAIAAKEEATRPYKQCVLVQATPADIQVSSTDDVTSVFSRLMGTAKEPGAALFPHRRLSAIINELPDGECEISVNPKLQVTIRSASSKRKFTMQSLEAEIFPKISERNPGEKLCSFEAKAFQQVSADVSLAVTEAYIHGALLIPEDKRFRMVSVDGRSLVVSSGDLLSCDGKSDSDIIVPQILMASAKLFPASNLPLSLHMTDQKVSLVSAETTISCNRLALRGYPEVWSMVLNGAPQKKRFRAQADVFLDTVRAVMVAADPEGSSIQVDIDYRGATCVISTREGAAGRGEDELLVIDPEPRACFFHLNGLVLLQALKSFGPEHVDVYFDEVAGSGAEAFFLRSETLTISITPIRSVK